MDSLGTATNPLRVAIVGSGPSGFYAAEALLESGLEVRVDLIERLPVPFGLVRFGVAPDHPKLKMATLVFDRIAQHPHCRFIGNVSVGRDVSLAELREHYHAILFSSGAESDRSLGIPGESLPGSHTATEFVGWYNGHPDFSDRHFDLSQETAVIIGQGNVAADVARILLTPVDLLAGTDMASHAVEALRGSRVREVHLIGRRGPAQAKFTPQELRELGEIPGVQVELDPADLELNAESLIELQDKKNFAAAKNVVLLRGWAARPPQDQTRRLVFHFLKSPVALLGSECLQHLVVEKNHLQGEPFAQTATISGERHTLPCGLVFRSIGYKGVPIPDLPFDERNGVLAHAAGRVLGEAGVYAAGWIKRGPSGIIGTNRACAVETVAGLLKDLESFDSRPKPGSEALLGLMHGRGLRALSYSDWQKIDAEETRIGREAGKPREKFTDVEAMLAVLDRA